jgi:hypothetical protein
MPDVRMHHSHQRIKGTKELTVLGLFFCARPFEAGTGNPAALGPLFPSQGQRGSVYRIWGTGGGGLQTQHYSETDEFPEIASFELLPAGTREALNASVPAEGRAEEDKSPL